MVFAHIRPRTVRPASGPLKINPIGDSITNGPQPAGGFRGPLLAMIAARLGGAIGSSGVVDSLGGKDNALYGYDPALTGTSASGYNNTSAAQWVANGWMSAFSPGEVHVGILFLGANDPGDSLTTVTAVMTLVDQFFALHPVAVLFVSNRLPRSFAETSVYNAGLAAAVAARRATGQNVVLVDNNSVIGLSDLYDGLHPNADGNIKIARQLYAAMSPYLR